STPPAPSALYTLSLHDALPILCSRPVASPVLTPRARTVKPPCRRPERRSRRCGRGQNELRPGGRVAFGPTRPRPGEWAARRRVRSEEHTSELQSLAYLVCRLLL